MSNTLPSTQKAVVLYPPSFDIRLEEVPVPKVVDADDAVVRIKLAGLCGSDLHAYRGAYAFDPFIMGHEFVGEVVALGSAYEKGGTVTDEQNYLSTALQLGDKVVAPFTTSCGECQFCRMELSCRCIHSLLFGSPSLPGAQAQYVRVPKASGTLIKLGSEEYSGIRDETLLLLADILPTGYYAVNTALRHPNLSPYLQAERSTLTNDEKQLVIAIIGLGPVGQCALVCAVELLYATSLSNFAIIAIDPNELRRGQASKIIDSVSRGTQNPGRGNIRIVTPEEAIGVADSLGGCHAACDIVGSNAAIRLAYSLLRPYGIISSAGVHTSPTFPVTGEELYQKNVSLSFGRCPARSLLPQALAILNKRREVFDSLIVERVVGFSDAGVKEAYEKFDKGVWGKVIFDPWG